MSKILFIGDTHFGHNGISSKFRKNFNTDEEHDEVIHENIMQASGKNNTLFLLGDICFKSDTFDKVKLYSEKYQKVFYCLGNHDHLGVLKELRDYVTFFGIIKKYKFWISHCPIHPQELYRGMNIHGHVHRNTVPDARYINVSCEAIDYKPITLAKVRDIFNQRKSDGLIVPYEVHKD